MIVEFRHDDMRALHEAYACASIRAGHASGGLRDPGSGRVDDCARGDVSALAAARVFQHNAPHGAVGLGGKEARAHVDVSAACFRVVYVEHDEPRVLHPAVGIFEGDPRAATQRRPRGVAVEAQRARRR